MPANNRDIELRSEKVRNIVGKVPPPLLRIGITIILFIILFVLGLGYFIPYPQYKIYPIQIHSYPVVQVVETSEQGIITMNINENKVQKGQTICTLKTETDSIIQFRANISGQLYCNCNNKDYIEDNSIIFSIIPDSISTFYGISHIPSEEMNNVNNGQNVIVLSSEQILTGSISHIYPIAEMNLKIKTPSYKIKIELAKENNLSETELLLSNTKWEVKILVSNKSIFKSVFGLDD